MQGKGFEPMLAGTTRIDSQLKSRRNLSIGNAFGNRSSIFIQNCWKYRSWLKGVLRYTGMRQ